jgi:hypothetical protein
MILIIPFRFPYGFQKEAARGQDRIIHSFSHLESLRGSMRMRLAALEEGILGASMHGGDMGAWTLGQINVKTG